MDIPIIKLSKEKFLSKYSDYCYDAGVQVYEILTGDKERYLLISYDLWRKMLVYCFDFLVKTRRGNDKLDLLIDLTCEISKGTTALEFASKVSPRQSLEICVEIENECLAVVPGTAWDFYDDILSPCNSCKQNCTDHCLYGIEGEVTGEGVGEAYNVACEQLYGDD